jgi:hypothetical protein
MLVAGNIGANIYRRNAGMAEQTREARVQALHRLAGEAKRKGEQIFVYVSAGEYYATSTSSPDELHQVTLMSCDCEGFLRWQRCTHHAALLIDLDELPPLPPTPAAPVEKRNAFDVTDAELAVLRGRALRIACETNTPFEWYSTEPAA